MDNMITEHKKNRKKTQRFDRIVGKNGGKLQDAREWV
jgi:hypothetical protein